MASTTNRISFWLVILWISNVKNQNNLYHTDRSGNTILFHDCFRYRVENRFALSQLLSKSRHPSQIIPYCIRPMTDEFDGDELNENNSSSFRFNMLNRMNVTVQDLLQWSIPFDLAEDYQEYLDTNNLNLAEKVVHNCSYRWFGSHCQYTIYPFLTFQNFIFFLFSEKKLSPPELIHQTCYTHLNCTSCIDWREVCDGKIDCPMGGVDEENCLDLEMNECAENEYRCQNGLCVPESFLNDSPFNPDCLDRTDEQEYQGAIVGNEVYGYCYKDPGFRCEESYSAARQKNFQCGDGQTSIILQKLCANERDTLHMHTLYAYEKNPTLSSGCWRMLSCLLDVGLTDEHECNQFCYGLQCTYNLQNNCHSHFVFFPEHVILHDHVRFIYLTNKTVQRRYWQLPPLPDYVCYDHRKCPLLRATLYLNGSACKVTGDLPVNSTVDIDRLFRTCSTEYRKINRTDLRLGSLFQCPGTTKLISKHRLVDGIADCFEGVDESFVDGCSLSHKHRFQCQSERKCIARAAVYDGVKDCAGEEDEIHLEKKLLPFHQFCNGFFDDERELIEGKNETDETNCEGWPCDNMYTRCDDAWSCLNGTDESKCPNRLCSHDTLPCVLPFNFTIICLPIALVNDGIVHCVGASDERSYCRSLTNGARPYKCWNVSKCVSTTDLCYEEECPFDHVESLCRRNSILEILTEMEYDTDTGTRLADKPFSIKDPEPLSHSINITKYSPSERRKMSVTDDYLDRNDQWKCNRGVPIKGLSKTEYHCFCPPSYYGDHCQFQNERVSLTLALRKVCAPKCFGVFTILVTLSDNEQVTHSQEQMTYIPTFDCDRKSNLYLLYNKQPKDSSKNYTVQVYVYNRIDMLYHASWIFPVRFPFLPVNRISVSLTIPATPVASGCSKYCGHGQCITFINAEKDFCLCHSGWSGAHCTMPLHCSCSSDSLCLGAVQNRSICLCPLHRTGMRCLLPSACQRTQCDDDRYICIPNDLDGHKHSSCICQAKFPNDRCDNNKRFEISFSQLSIPQALLAHFIVADPDSPLERDTVFSKIKSDQNEAILYSFPRYFHLLFFQILHEYYLLMTSKAGTVPPVTKIQVDPSRRCPHIRELLDRRTSSFPLLRRVKSYHMVCKQQSDLHCFHDEETFMCLCTSERHANCFRFDFNITYNCQGLNDCKNNAQCFSDTPHCPTWVTCVCPECFYGSKCQFTTKSSILSLDTILGYSIRPHAPLSRQFIPIKVSLIITISMLCIGCINGLVSIMTFRIKSLQESGCGCYLLALSIVSLLLMIFFTLKFLFLLLSQMAILTNRTFLDINCVSMDFLLRSFLAISDWLNASIAIERAIMTVQGISFNKKKSRHVARLVLILVVLIVFASHVHDPIHRRIIEDEEDERLWCIVQYRSFHLEIFNSVMNVLHFVLPFSINLISALTIIVTAARQRASVQKQLSYREHLHEQWSHHNHLIISPIILVLLAVPRLIISFLSGCMKSTRDPWLFLAGYFISYVPPLLTFVIYVLPSTTYKKHFYTLLRQYRTTCWRALCIR